MKNRIALTTAFTLMLALPAGAQVGQSATAGPPVAVTAPDPALGAVKTKVALECILGMAARECQLAFRAGALTVFQRVVWQGGPNPYLRSADYVRQNNVGDEVWDVKIRGTEYTYIIAQPDQDGGIARLFVLQGGPNPLCDNQIEQAVEHGGRVWVSCNALYSSATPQYH